MKFIPLIMVKNENATLQIQKELKSSNGTVQLRASIKVDILFFGKKI